MSTPINKLFDSADWQPTTAEPPADGSAYATHFGILKIGEMELRVFQLNTGERTILEEDMAAFFGQTKEQLREIIGMIEKNKGEEYGRDFSY
jgi:hypothetical protein